MTQPIFDTADKHAPKRLRPKDAATLIIVRRDKDGLRVLMGKRHANLAFQPNKFVFPGGRVDPADQRIAAGGALASHVAEKVERDVSAARARALALAAVREAFEETGVLVGERSSEIPRTRASAWRKFFTHGVVPRLDRLDYVARAITPPGRTRRFDARFFMVDAKEIVETVDASEQQELLTLVWPTLAEARALDLPGITRRVLDEVEAHASGDTKRPIPFFRSVRGKPHVSYL